MVLILEEKFLSSVSIISNASNISNKVENEAKSCKNEGAYIRGNTVCMFAYSFNVFWTTMRYYLR